MRAQQTERSAQRSSLRKATALRSILLTSTSIVTLSMVAPVPQAKAQTNTTSSQWTVQAAGAGGVNGNDPTVGDVTYPGIGGTGGTVTTTNQAAITVNGTSNGMPAVWINAPGGVGGNAYQAITLLTETQSGATGGTGGQITFTNSAALSSTDSQTIWLFAYGGVGGSGATSHRIAPSIAGMGGQGGTITATIGSTLSASNLNSSCTCGSALFAVADGGAGGFAPDNGGQLIAASGAAGGNAGTVTINGVGTTITTSGAAVYGIQVSATGGAGSQGGAGGQGFSDDQPAPGGNGGTGGTITVTMDRNSSITTTGNYAIGILAQANGGAGGNTGAGEGGLTLFNFPSQAGSSGSGGSVTITNDGSISTMGIASHGIFAQSAGGNGGSGTGGWGLLVSQGTNGQGGGNGGAVSVSNAGSIATAGDGSMGIVAQSMGGLGGAGANAGSLLVSIGGGGGTAGSGNSASVSNAGTISTAGSGAAGIVALSIGGGGGVVLGDAVQSAYGGTGGGGGGTAVTILGPLAIGGSSGGGGTGGNVSVTNAGSVTTSGESSPAILAQSIGGGGGAAGGSWDFAAFASISIGGSGGNGGNGGDVTVNNLSSFVTASQITTSGPGSQGISAQSIGGGGGNGGGSAGVALGFPTEFTAGAAYSFALTLGGSGGTGGNGGAVAVNNITSIVTQDADSTGIYASSVGGGGGNGGYATSVAVSFTAPAATPSAAVALAIGGTGGGGGNGGAVTVNNYASVTTQGDNSSFAILAQSIGGGGGAGGNALTVTDVIGGPNENASISVSVGGKGGSGGTGGAVNVSNYAALSTQGAFSDAIVAQSVGGGGGTGGLGAAYSVPQVIPTNKSVAIAVAVGGAGGVGGDAGAVTAVNSAAISTGGISARGIFAQSVGGGGGVGGGGQAVGVSTIATVNVGVGGSGGVAGAGSTVSVTNNVGGNITTTNDGGMGILAQSIGGGGGAGGAASAAGALPNGGITLANAYRAYQSYTRATGGQNPNNQTGFNFDIGVNVGGAGAAGGAGANVTVSNAAAISTNGDIADGIIAQSIGGGGGVGGGASGMGVALANIQLFVGGKGAAAGSAGAVDLTNSGAVTTTGDHSLGLFAQSVGGGGGTGGSTSDGSNLSSLAALEASTQIGGNGGANGNGGNVTVTNNGAITTSGNFSHGIVAQSVGGGGGQFYINFQTFNADGLTVPSQDAVIYASPGTPTTGAGGNTGGTGNSLDLNVSMGGNGGASGTGGMVSITNSAAISTTGADSYGIFAQSIGGGGGFGGVGAAHYLSVTSAIGGIGAGAGTGRTVSVTLNNGSFISTTGTGATAIVAQSIGGGGGAVGGISGTADVTFPGGGTGGAGGDGGSVTISTGTGTVTAAPAQITTTGYGAHGIWAQSDGGGGGSAGTWNGMLSLAPSLSGATGSPGAGGAVTINYTGNISTTGQHAIAVYAESLGSSGNGQINITLGAGTIVGGSGNMAAGIGIVGGTSNNLTIAQGTSISTGTYGFAIAATGGGTLTVTNSGTVSGNVDLGMAPNSFTNNGKFYPGSTVNINNMNGTTGWTPPGASLATASPNITPLPGVQSTGDVFTDAGITNVAGPGVVNTTNLQTSSYTQTNAGTLQVDVNYSNRMADKLAITGTASLAGKIAPNLVALPTNGQTSQAALTVLTAASLSGSPTVVNTAATTWSLNQTSTNLTLALDSLNFDNPMVMTKQAAMVADHLQAIYLTGAFGSLGPAMLALANMPGGDSARYDRALSKLGSEGSTAGPARSLVASTRFAKSLNSCPVFVGETALLNEHSCMWSKVDGGVERDYNPGGVTGYRNSWTAFSAGGQHNIGDNWFLGGAFSIGQSALNDNDRTFNASSDDYAAGIVVKKQIADAWLVSVSGTYMYNSVGTSRLVTSELVTGMPPVALAHMNINTFGGRGEIAYYADFGRMYAKPLIDLDVVDTRVPGYAESGAGIWDLKFKAASKTQFGVSPALELGQRINLDGGVLRAYGSAGVSYWTNPGWQQVANFEGETSGVRGFANVFTGSSTYAVGRVGAEVVGLYNMTGRIQYDVLGNSHFLSQVISARIGYLF